MWDWMPWYENNKIVRITGYPDLQIQNGKGFNLSLGIERGKLIIM